MRNVDSFFRFHTIFMGIVLAMVVTIFGLVIWAFVHFGPHFIALIDRLAR